MDNNFFPWDEIPDSNVFPTMTGRFQCVKLEDGESQSSRKRMFRAQFNCMEPSQYAGMSHFENFVTGNDENPKGIVPGAMGTRSLKAALNAMQMSKNKNVGELCQIVTASQPQLMLSIAHTIEQKGDYAGQERNKITAYHKVGDRPVQVMTQGTSVGVETSMAPKMVAPPPMVPTAAVQQAPAPPQVVQQMMPQPPTAQASPALVVPPVVNAAPAPTAPPAGQGYVLDCVICGNKVPVAEFSAHVARHQTEPGWNGK